HWLYLALLHITQKIEAQAHGFKSTLLHVQKKDIDNQFVLTPPVAEQKKISQILSTWNKAISVTEKLLANSQQQKKALIQQLLTGKKRLLDENGVRFSGEWCTCTLSEVAHIIMGSSPKSEAYNDNGLGLPLIQGNADIKCRVSCPRVYTSDITKECTPGDILLSVRAPVGTVALSQHKACIGRGISAIKSKRKMSQSFLYQWFLWFEPKWCYLSQGSTFESINSDDIKTLKLSVPNFEEQQKIAAVLSAADTEISTLEKKLACLKNEKKALMQQLLTGKRRVKVDEAVAV
ncbi:TPA: restriction endonuclease subunit S, partial [Escherichia coli]|nr:restriction endonuclease subunit S [Escherichia coli]